MSKNKNSLLWFRRDLRLSDNPALKAALARGAPIIPVFIDAPQDEGSWPDGSASRWWLHQSLAALEETLHQRHSRLILRRGAASDVLRQLLVETGASAIFWNRRYEPEILQRDKSIVASLRAANVEVQTFNGSLLVEPWDVKTQAGTPFQVFTPFWRSCLNQLDPPVPLPAPSTLPSPQSWPASIPLNELSLEPATDWATGIKKAWEPGENGAHDVLKRFLDGPLSAYQEGRNRPDQPGTSRMSPYLHFGEISPGQIWEAIQRRSARSSRSGSFSGAEIYLREIGWREFAVHLLFHFPQTPEKPLHSSFERFPWRKDPLALRAWQKGQTGYPLVDAGMRQLWSTGWMHNRVRMIAASFLVKDLLISWQEGARWFWDTLADADLANNTLGWQWTSGCGADAAPYFRVFNPILQGEKFDPQGDYVRRWVPELAGLPPSWIHKPWEAPGEVARNAGLSLGQEYPRPLIDHKQARERALVALSHL